MAGIFVIMQFIVLGIEQMDFATNIMKPANLLLNWNELIPSSALPAIVRQATKRSTPHSGSMAVVMTGLGSLTFRPT
jgi:hypothetical protein